MLKKVIATGSASTEDAAIEWLKAHGAIVESALGIDIIELPENARIEGGSHHWQKHIVFSDADGNEEPQCVEVELDVDANETALYLITTGDEED
ncbi:MAG TPA: hypothetical protein VH593_18035 [Ktedonobacteraceae bacterium]